MRAGRRTQKVSNSTTHPRSQAETKREKGSEKKKTNESENIFGKI